MGVPLVNRALLHFIVTISTGRQLPLSVRSAHIARSRRLLLINISALLELLVVAPGCHLLMSVLHAPLVSTAILLVCQPQKDGVRQVIFVGEAPHLELHTLRIPLLSAT